MTRNNADRQRLEKKINNLHTEWNLRIEQLAKLRQALILETNAAIQFQLEQQIRYQQTQVQDLEHELSQIEQLLANQLSPKNVTEYIANRGHLVHKLKAKDSTGRWAYYFILVETDLEEAFMQAIESNQSINIEDYGKVIASCYGEQPDNRTKALLREKYGFII